LHVSGYGFQVAGYMTICSSKPLGDIQFKSTCCLSLIAQPETCNLPLPPALQPFFKSQLSLQDVLHCIGVIVFIFITSSLGDLSHFRFLLFHAQLCYWVQETTIDEKP